MYLAKNNNPKSVRPDYIYHKMKQAKPKKSPWKGRIGSKGSCEEENASLEDAKVFIFGFSIFKYIQKPTVSTQIYGE